MIMIKYVKRIQNGFRRLRNRKWVVGLLSFATPAFVMIMVCIALKIYPFGEKSFLMSDMSNQYVSFLSYFRTLFGGGNDFLYTFSKSLGGDMAGLSAYYLFSPFNFITLFFSTDQMPVAIDIIIISKIAMCGLSFNYFIRKSYGGGVRTLLFSTAYALMAYNIAYCFNIIWLDGVILLPLIVLGIRKVFDNKTPLLYLFSLFAALVTNYYIGFMLCIFSVIYFIYRFIQDIKPNCLRPLLKKIITYVVVSAAAACLAAVVLIPALLSLQGGKATFSFDMLAFTQNFSFMDVFAKLFTNAFSWDQEISGLPNIFCGIPMVILAIQYFLNRQFSVKQKISTAGLMLFLLVNFHVNSFNLIWHGFNPPSWFPYRYSFIFSFLIILLAYKNFQNIEGIKIKQLIQGLLIFIVVAIVIGSKNMSFLSFESVYFDVFLALVCSALIYAYSVKSRINLLQFGQAANRKSLVIIVALLAILQIGNVGVNAYNSIGQLNQVFNEDVGYYSGFASQTEKVIDSVKSIDNGMYRIEKTFQYNANDPMLLNYNGLSHFSSTDKDFVKTFLGKLGFRNNGNWVNYNFGSTTAADSLLGVKYLLTKNETDKPYSFLVTKDEITAYQNPYAFPLAFTASKKITDVDITTEQNLFKIQNMIYKSLTSQDMGDIFTSTEVLSTSLVNLSEEAAEDLTVYTKIDNTMDAYIEYTIRIDKNDKLYGYLYAPYVQNAELYVNGQPIGRYFDINRWDIFSLGNYQMGETVQLTIKLLDTTLTMQGADFYYENVATLNNYYQTLQSGFCSIKEIKSSVLEGSVNVLDDGRYLLFSIPYESGWRIYIDGKPTETVMIFNALLGVPISKGEHTIRMRYIPSGFAMGVAISSVSLLIIIGYIIFLIRKRR